jgi:hypothetical protein
MRRRWSIGPVFVLRHAGMPFDWLLRLTAPDTLLAAADRVLATENAVFANDPRPEPVGGALLHCAPQRLPTPRQADARRAIDDWQAAVQEYQAHFAAAECAAHAELIQVLRRPQVREAVFLSSQHVYGNMLVPLIERELPATARWRRAYRQLYTYLLRFCAKNETVSFFGPMAYGLVEPGQAANDVRLHTDRPIRRRVFFAAWAAREVARSVAADRRLRADLPFRPTGCPAPDPDLALLLEALGSGASLRQAVSLSATVGPAAGSARELSAALRALVTADALEFGVAPAADDPEPLRSMLALLEAMPSGPARDEWRERIAELETLRSAIEKAPRAQREVLVPQLLDAFTQCTGRPARRGEGAVYADRTIFFEECGSPFELNVGPHVVAGWAARLSPALELSVAHGDATQRAATARVCDTFADATAMTLLEYADRTRAAFDANGSRFAADHAPTYPVATSAESVARLVDAAQKLPGDRYALVDLCPVAARPGDLADAPLVLARVHHHLLTDGWLATMFDDRAGFAAAAKQWVATQPDLVGVDVGRRNKGFYRFPGRYLVMRAPSHVDANERAVWPADVRVQRNGTAIRCVTPDGRPLRAYLALSDMVKYPPLAAISHPQVHHAIFDGPSDLPEVLVGDLVYQRARWRLDPFRLTTASAAARFLELRRIAARTGERFLFVRSDAERKPYLFDLACVLAADLAAHVAGHAGGHGPAGLVAEAMRPGPEELWLRDSDGQRYTCELRMQVIGSDTEKGTSE